MLDRTQKRVGHGRERWEKGKKRSGKSINLFVRLVTELLTIAWLPMSVTYDNVHMCRNAIMFCVNFTFANFASADGIAKKNITNLLGWLLVGVVNGHVDVEPMNVS